MYRGREAKQSQTTKRSEKATGREPRVSRRARKSQIHLSMAAIKKGSAEDPALGQRPDALLAIVSGLKELARQLQMPLDDIPDTELDGAVEDLTAIGEELDQVVETCRRTRRLRVSAHTTAAAAQAPARWIPGHPVSPSGRTAASGERRHAAPSG